MPQSIAAFADELNHYEPMSNFYKGSVTVNDGKKAFLFSTDALLIALELSTEIYCDGTFSVSLTIIHLFYYVGTVSKYRILLKVVPRVPPLSQLYTIHLRYMDKVNASRR